MADFDQYSASELQLLGTSNDSTGVLIRDATGAALYARVTTVPSNGAAGYAKGCIVMHLNASIGSVDMYVNTGTSTSCVFGNIERDGAITMIQAAQYSVAAQAAMPPAMAAIYNAATTYPIFIHPDHPDVEIFTTKAGSTAASDGDRIGRITDPFGAVFPHMLSFDDANQRPYLRVSGGKKSIRMTTGTSLTQMNQGDFSHTAPFDMVVAGYFPAGNVNIWDSLYNTNLTYNGTAFRMYNGSVGYFDTVTDAAGAFRILHWRAGTGLRVYNQAGTLLGTGLNNEPNVINWGNGIQFGGTNDGFEIVFAFDSSTAFSRPGLDIGLIDDLIAAIASDYAGWTPL